jgi:hypothetical protein
MSNHIGVVFSASNPPRTFELSPEEVAAVEASADDLDRRADISMEEAVAIQNELRAKHGLPPRTVEEVLAQ